MSKEHQTGKRFQVIILQIHRDKSGAVKELLALQDYFKNRNENYKFVGSTYGSPSNSLVKAVDFYLETNQSF